MKTRTSALYQRTADYRRNQNGWLGSLVAIGFALLPLGVMLWAVPQTGIGLGIA